MPGTLRTVSCSKVGRIDVEAAHDAAGFVAAFDQVEIFP